MDVASKMENPVLQATYRMDMAQALQNYMCCGVSMSCLNTVLYI